MQMVFITIHNFARYCSEINDFFSLLVKEISMSGILNLKNITVKLELIPPVLSNFTTSKSNPKLVLRMIKCVFRKHCQLDPVSLSVKHILSISIPVFQRFFLWEFDMVLCFGWFKKYKLYFLNQPRSGYNDLVK